MAEAPHVSVIVPARDEEAHIEECVRSCLAQDVPGGLEVIVADGRSTDRTRELAEAAGARVVDNPACTIPAGLNRALAEAVGRVVVRFDAHAAMPAGYVTACLAALEVDGAANVGGWRRVVPRGPWGRAVGVALASPAGVGNSRIWREPPPGQQVVDVDTVPLGAWRAETLRAAGGWDETLLSNEDFELNHRLVGLGGRVLFDPAIWSVYHPRESPGAVVVQYLRYGYWKASMLVENPRSLAPRQLAPLGLLAVAAAAPMTRVGRVGFICYGAGISVVAARSRQWRVAPTLAAMHLSWAAGFVGGLAARVVRR